MTELEALTKTLNRWKRIKSDIAKRIQYKFKTSNCLLCKLVGRYYECEDDMFKVQNCKDCPWHKAFPNEEDYSCSLWIKLFQEALSFEEAEMWKDAIIGMLEYLIEEKEIGK